jgi:hypothetical protein
MTMTHRQSRSAAASRNRQSDRRGADRRPGEPRPEARGHRPGYASATGQPGPVAGLMEWDIDVIPDGVLARHPAGMSVTIMNRMARFEPPTDPTTAARVVEEIMQAVLRNPILCPAMQGSSEFERFPAGTIVSMPVF